MAIVNNTVNGEGKSAGKTLREDLNQILRDLIQLGKHLVQPVLNVWTVVFERLLTMAEECRNEIHKKRHQKEWTAAQKAMKDKLSKVVDLDRKSSRRR